MTNASLLMCFTDITIKIVSGYDTEDMKGGDWLSLSATLITSAKLTISTS